MSTNWDDYLTKTKNERTSEQFPEWAQKATTNRLKVECVRSLANMALLHLGASEATLRGYFMKIIEECGPASTIRLP